MALKSPRQQKVLFVLIDGLGDVAVPSLDHQTPLAAAKTPFLDSIAQHGINGQLDPVEPSLACGSDTAHMSILGYEPRIHYRGRGAYESMGAGLPMIPGDIAFKSNFATFNPETKIVSSRRADRNFEKYGPPFCEELDGLTLPSFPGFEVSVKYATEHRCGVRVRGPGLSDCITGTDPLKDNLPLLTCLPTDATPEAELTSRLVNELSERLSDILGRSDLNRERKEKGLSIANCVLLRGCGSCIDVPSFEELHKLKPFMIAPTCIIAGLGMTLHFDIVTAPGATGDYHTNLESKFRTALQNITDPERAYQFGFIHVKAVDDAGHDKNVALKLKFLEEIDRCVGFVLESLRDREQTASDQYFVCVTGDHSTPVLYGDHSFEPVPFTICAVSSFPPQSAPKKLRVDESQGTRLTTAGFLVDSVQGFSELQASQGVLGRFPGSEVMGIIKRYIHMASS